MGEHAAVSFMQAYEAQPQYRVGRDVLLGAMACKGVYVNTYRRVIYLALAIP